MATLEVINGNDIGSNAIKKLDRNIKAVNLEVEDIDISDLIVNNLTSTDATKALAATQGKILDDTISILTVGRGYETSKVQSAKDLNTIILNGMYYCTEPTANFPTGLTNSNGYLKVHVSGSVGYLTQTYIGVVDDKMFFRRCTGGAWQPWKQLATTDKIDILCTANTVYTIINQRNQMINNVMYYFIDVQKTDGTSFSINVQHSVANAPTIARPTTTTIAMSCSGFTTATFYTGVGVSTIGANGNITVSTSSADVTLFRISGVVVL